MDPLSQNSDKAHARRSFADAIKAMKKSDPKALKKTTAYQALVRIAGIYKLENTLKDLSPKERLKERQKQIEPFVDEYFAWVKQCIEDCTVSPKSETGKGLNYSMNQENYLRTFLTDGEVPIDNSASERSIRTFCIGKKNFVLINSIKGADASAVIYSLSETAKLNNLNPYYYFEHLFSVLPQYITYNDKEGSIDTTKLPEKVLQELLPWSDKLPVKCHKTRR